MGDRDQNYKPNLYIFVMLKNERALETAGKHVTKGPLRKICHNAIRFVPFAWNASVNLLLFLLAFMTKSHPPNWYSKRVKIYTFRIHMYIFCTGLHIKSMCSYVHVLCASWFCNGVAFLPFSLFVCRFLGKMGQRNVWRALKINVAYFAVPVAHTSHNIQIWLVFFKFLWPKICKRMCAGLIAIARRKLPTCRSLVRRRRWEILHSFWDSSHWQFTKRFSCSMCGRYAQSL